MQTTDKSLKCIMLEKVNNHLKKVAFNQYTLCNFLPDKKTNQEDGFIWDSENGKIEKTNKSICAEICREL